MTVWHRGRSVLKRTFQELLEILSLPQTKLHVTLFVKLKPAAQIALFKTRHSNTVTFKDRQRRHLRAEDWGNTFSVISRRFSKGRQLLVCTVGTLQFTRDRLWGEVFQEVFADVTQCDSTGLTNVTQHVCCVFRAKAPAESACAARSTLDSTYFWFWINFLSLFVLNFLWAPAFTYVASRWGGLRSVTPYIYLCGPTVGWTQFQTLCKKKHKRVHCSKLLLKIDVKEIGSSSRASARLSFLLLLLVSGPWLTACHGETSRCRLEDLLSHGPVLACHWTSCFFLWFHGWCIWGLVPIWFFLK